MLINLVEQLRFRLSDSLASCGLSQVASEMAMARLAELVDAVHPQDSVGHALKTVSWLDFLKHRSDVFEAINVAVLCREISRAMAADGKSCNSAVMQFVHDLELSNAYRGVIEHLLALPGAGTCWEPSTPDEAVVLDTERVWFGGPAQEYRQRVGAIRASALDQEQWLNQRKENLIRIVDSGLIFFLPETRSALEGRAFLNLSFEIAAINADQVIEP